MAFYVSTASGSSCCFSHALRLATELRPECVAKVKQNICNIVRFRVVLTCVLYQICVNVRLASWHTRSKQTTARFQGMYT